ncbi:hypothetical protein [Streptomyces sp. G-G2]|uniref:hypothetical protein n=1 Tax=Streptomyces sp. G-G2 TaxID=3046201 RepID=UPI0024BABA2A|nr:hypothetical protein [Streptomyces sp. G-G2]MDJ0386394.1 hypothetical protein [Streptomyces sp. G-G2]
MLVFMRGGVALLVLSAAVAGCTSGAPAGKGGFALTSAELSDALLTGEQSGFYATPQEEPLLEDVDVVTAADPSCQPLADLTSVTPKHVPVGTAWAALEVRGAATEGSVVLTSYARGEAEAKMGELKAALATCRELSASSRRGWSERTSVVALPSVSVGDESVSYSVTSAEAPGKGRVMTIVRTGGSMAVYLIPAEVNRSPASLMKQQHKKIHAAG